MLKPHRASIQELDEKGEAEKLAGLLPSLTLAAAHQTSAHDIGVHGRRRTGIGEDFWQFKQYGPDDATTSIDWRQSAKREHVFIRQKEQETSESVWFWCDNTVTMKYASRTAETNKASRASVLTMALALLLSQGGEKFGLFGHSEKAATGSTAFNKFAADMNRRGEFNFDTFLKTSRLPRKSTIVMISDFLAPIENLKTAIRTFVDLGCNGLLVHVADPAEVDLPFSGRTRFEGLSDEEGMTIGRVESVQSEYQDLFREHRQAVITLASQFSWEYAFHRTDENASSILAEAFEALQVKGV